MGNKGLRSMKLTETMDILSRLDELEQLAEGKR
jgi:hypothetical protein